MITNSCLLWMGRVDGETWKHTTLCNLPWINYRLTSSSYFRLEETEHGLIVSFDLFIVNCGSTSILVYFKRMHYVVSKRKNPLIQHFCSKMSIISLSLSHESAQKMGRDRSSIQWVWFILHVSWTADNFFRFALGKVWCLHPWRRTRWGHSLLSPNFRKCVDT